MRGLFQSGIIVQKLSYRTFGPGRAGIGAFQGEFDLDMYQ